MLMFQGFDPKIGGDMATCLVDEYEKVYDQKQMQAVINQEVIDTHSRDIAKHCACDVVKDPDAFAAGFCK